MNRNKILDFVIFAGFGISGAAALIYEVVWTRSLSGILGSSTYALSTMLAAFMGGLSVGGFLGGRIAKRLDNIEKAFALTELGIGIFGLITIPLIRLLSPIFVKSFFTFQVSFNSLSIAQFLISFLIMGIPTTLMGMTFPLMIKHFSKKHGDIGLQAGNLYSVNTIGAIFGSITAGFILIPLFGINGAVLVAVAFNLLTALLILILLRQSVLPIVISVVVTLGGLIVIDRPYIPLLSYYILPRFASFKTTQALMKNIGPMLGDLVLFHHEGADGEVFVIKSPMGRADEKILLSGNKLEGGDNKGFALLALLPYFNFEHIAVREDALNIGLGSGRTLKHLSRLPFSRIDSVELSEGVLEANRRILSPELFEDKRISHIRADGRNYILLTDKQYDMMIISPSWAVDMSSGGLLTHEFFTLAKQRLKKDGVISVWADLKIMKGRDAEILIRTFSRNFPNATAWWADDNMILVGSETAQQHPEDHTMQAVQLFMPEMKTEFFHVHMNPEQIRSLPPGPINTDNKPILEFHNARNFINPPKQNKNSPREVTP